MGDFRVVREQNPLPRVLGTWDGLAITIGRVIGTGIFLTAPAVAAYFTTAGPAILVWILGAILTMLGAWTLSELAAARPRTGGQYIYLLDAYGPSVAFVFGWLQLLIGPAGLGAVALGFGIFFVSFFQVEWLPEYVAVAALLLLTSVAILRTRFSTLLMTVFTPMKLLTLAVLIWLGAFLLEPDADRFSGLLTFAAADGSLLGAMGLAIMGVIWTFGGWEATTAMAGEIRNPEKSLPRILTFTIIGVAVIYMAMNLTYIHAIGVAGLGKTENAARDSGEMMIGPMFGALITFMILCSVFSGFNSNILSGARGIHAMANTGLTFRFLGVNSRWETPYVALLWRMTIGCALVLLWPSFFDLLRFEVFAAQAFMILIAASVFVFRRRGDPLPYKAPFHPWTPILYMLLNIAILGNELYNRPWEGTAVLGILVAALPVYYVWRAMSGRDRLTNSSQIREENT